MLEMRDGFLYDSVVEDHFIPRGVSYIVLNPHAHSDPSPEEIAADFRAIASHGFNSIRTELPWPRLHLTATTFDWEAADHIVAEAGRNKLRLFLLIGYQFPPAWVGAGDPDLLATLWNPERGETVPSSDMLNLCNPNAVALYEQYMAAIAERYRGNPTIAAFILGNEFSFYNLFGNRHFIGFDKTWSIPSYSNFLSRLYGDSADALNARWGTSYVSVQAAALNMATDYPADSGDYEGLRQSGYHDLLQWRANVIAGFVAAGAAAVRKVDPERLLTYSTVGGLFSHSDTTIVGENGVLIASKCREAGAPLSFWSINTYPEASRPGHDRRSLSFSISRFRHQIRLPVLVTETGISTEDCFFPEAGERAPAVRCSLPWECLMSGAIGYHIFHWHDRAGASGIFSRENFFGIVDTERKPKPGFDRLAEVVSRTSNVAHHFVGSLPPEPDVGIYWSTDSDVGINRATVELATIWSAFRRRGYQPGFIDFDGFEQEAWRQVRAVYLGRNSQMHPKHLEALESKLIASGIHVHASGDIPGQFDAWHRPNPAWQQLIESLFGVVPDSSHPAWDGSTKSLYFERYRVITERVLAAFGPYLPIQRPFSFSSWKIWRKIRVTAGMTVTEQIANETPDEPEPCLHLMEHGPERGRAAIHLCAIGDTQRFPPDYTSQELWIQRYNAISAVYYDHFGMRPALSLSGRISKIVLALDHRFTRNGGVLISLLNISSKDVGNVVLCSSLLVNKEVISLTDDSVPERTGDDRIVINVAADSMKILLCKP
jgi:hypothetical protein